MEKKMELNERTIVERELNSIMEATLRLENELVDTLSTMNKQ